MRMMMMKVGGTTETRKIKIIIISIIVTTDQIMT